MIMSAKIMGQASPVGIFSPHRMRPQLMIPALQNDWTPIHEFEMNWTVCVGCEYIHTYPVDCHVNHEYSFDLVR